MPKTILVLNLVVSRFDSGPGQDRDADSGSIPLERVLGPQRGSRAGVLK